MAVAESLEEAAGFRQILFASNQKLIVFPFRKSGNMLVNNFIFVLFVSRFERLSPTGDPCLFPNSGSLRKMGRSPARVLKNTSKSLRPILGLLGRVPAEIDDIPGLVNSVIGDKADRLCDLLRLRYVVVDVMKE